jgi:hypothetical protein
LRRREREESEACRSSGSSTTKCVSSFFSLSFYLDGRRHGATEGERENEGLLCYLARSRWKKRKRSKSFSILFEERRALDQRKNEREKCFFLRFEVKVVFFYSRPPSLGLSLSLSRPLPIALASTPLNHHQLPLRAPRPRRRGRRPRCPASSPRAPPPRPPRRSPSGTRARPSSTPWPR